MLEAARPYPAYKDSGQPWLGEVPEHWELRRGKTLFVRANRPVRPEDETVTCFRDGQVTLRRNRRTTGFTEAIAEFGYQGVRKGDLVIHAMDAFAGAVGISDSDGKASPICGIGIPQTGADASYFAYVVREMARRQWILALAKGIRERSTDFRFDTFGNQFLPTPPPPEQASIVKVLSAVDRRVNRLVRAKRRLLALLAEQKQAVITHAVTRGLDPTAPTKPSGVPWLGEVPAHWEVRRLRSVCDITTGGRDTQDRVDNGEYPFYVRSQTPERINSYSFDGEAVLTAGDGAGVAKVFHYVTGKFDFHQRVYKFSNFRVVQGRFFFEYFRQTLAYEALAGNAKSTVDSLRRPMLQNFPVLVPPSVEQEAILRHVLHATQSLDAAADLARREIDLIREYRTRLVADVVTGKLDVRAVADALPDDDDEEPVEIDEADADETAEELEPVLEGEEA